MTKQISIADVQKVFFVLEFWLLVIAYNAFHPHS